MPKRTQSSSITGYLGNQMEVLTNLSTRFNDEAILDFSSLSVAERNAFMPVLKDMRHKRLIESPGKQLLIDATWSPNDFLIRQLLLGQGIYSGPTALYLWGLSDQYPYQIYMTFKRGYKLPKKLDTWTENVVARQNRKELLAKFVMSMPVVGTQKQIHLYSRERCLVEILRRPYANDIELMNTAYRRYLKESKGNVNNLLLTAQTFKMSDRVSKLLEILL